MSVVRSRDGAVAALFVLLLVIAFAVLASIDMRDPDPAPSPTPESLTLEAPVSAPVVVDASLDLDVGELVVEAIPPKAEATPLEAFIPKPEPVVVAAPEPVRERAAAVSSSSSSGTSTSSPAPAPAPAAAPAPAPAVASFESRVRSIAADYCPSAGVIIDDPRLGGVLGKADWYNGTLLIASRADGGRLRGVIAHECAHLVQYAAYGGDIAALEAATNAAHGTSGWSGLERNADCIAARWGAPNGHYTSACGGAAGDAAATIAAGGRYVP